MTFCLHILSDADNKTTTTVTMRRNISYDCSLTKLLLVVRWTLGSRERTQACRRCTFDFFNAYFSVLKMHISLFLRLHISLFPKLLCVPLLLHWLGFTWLAWEDRIEQAIISIIITIIFIIVTIISRCSFRFLTPEITPPSQPPRPSECLQAPNPSKNSACERPPKTLKPY